MTTIFYNGQNAFSDAVGTPLVSVTSSYDYINSSLSRLKKFTLRGKLLTEDICTDGFSQLYEKQQDLIQKFSKNFSSFSIIENGNTIFSHTAAIVKSVTFDESRYFNLISFSVEIDCYDYNFAANGILNPSDLVSVENSEDGIKNITRTISCRSINTTISAVQNAKTFILSRVASLSPQIDPISCLTSRVEKVNHLTGECSITLSYINDPNNRQGIGNKGVLSYNFELAQDQERIQVSVNGSMAGGMDATPAALRAGFNNLNWYSLCAAEYESTFSDGDLSEAPLQFSVTEDFANNSISFNISYDNISNKEAYYIDTVSVSQDYSTGSKCISLRLDFLADYGCKQDRWNKVQQLFNSTNFDSILASKWATYGSGRIGSSAKSKSHSYSENAATISSQATYCTDNLEDCGCLQDFSYSMSFSPPIDKYSAASVLNGEGDYYIQDLGFQNRFRFSINGKYTPSRCCSREESERQLLSRINYIVSIYFPASDRIIEEKSIEYNEFGIVNFSFSFNGEMSFTMPPPSPSVSGGNAQITFAGIAYEWPVYIGGTGAPFGSYAATAGMITFTSDGINYEFTAWIGGAGGSTINISSGFATITIASINYEWAVMLA